MNYALIQNNVVSNIIFLNPSNAYEFPQAVATDGLSVAIGDTYEDGKFYRDGVEIEMPIELEYEESDFNIIESYQDAIQALETGHTEGE